MFALLTLVAALSVETAPAAPPVSAVNAFVVAMENADADALAAAFAEDATVFMPFDSVPQRFTGRTAVRDVFARFFEGVRKQKPEPPYMKLEPRDLETQLLDDDTAIVTFHLGRPPAPDATTPSSLSRRTFVVQRVGGRWVIKHLHASNIRFEPKKSAD